MAVAATGNATLHKINNSRNSLANNEQTFLKLLTTQLKNKEASWSYTQARSATAVKVEVVDKFGKTVRTVLPDDMAGGEHTFKWDGKDDKGVQQPEGGDYTIKVTATDPLGTNIATTAKGRLEGVVTKVTNEKGVNMVWIGDTKV